MSTILGSLMTYWPVHLLLAAYTGVLAYHAWRGSRETHGLADYYVGGRSMGGVTLGLSFFATYSSTNSFVGFAGQSYEWGIAWLLLAAADRDHVGTGLALRGTTAAHLHRGT